MTSMLDIYQESVCRDGEDTLRRHIYVGKVHVLKRWAFLGMYIPDHVLRVTNEQH